MAQTYEGFDGTINAAGMARIFDLLQPPVFGSDADYRITAVANSRRIVIGPGESEACFVRVHRDEAETFDFAAPSSGGKWWAAVERRSWTTPAVVERLMLAGPATSSAVTVAPNLPPDDSEAAGLALVPGISYDVVIGWVWVRATTNEVVVYDRRRFRDINDNPPVVVPTVRWESLELVSLGAGTYGKLTDVWTRVRTIGRSADWFSSSGSVLTIKRNCLVRVRVRLAIANAPAGAGSLKFFVLNNSTAYTTNPPQQFVMLEDEVVVSNQYRIWSDSENIVPLRAGDQLRVAYASNVGGSRLVGSPNIIVPLAFAEFALVGPLE